MDKIKLLKELYDEGLMGKEEYDDRRLQVIDSMCSRMLSPSSMPRKGKQEQQDAKQTLEEHCSTSSSRGQVL